MKKAYRRFIPLLFGILSLLLSVQAKAQTGIWPDNDDFSWYTGADVALPANSISGFSSNSAKNLNYTIIGPSSGAGWLGLTPGGLFRAGNKAIFFNYTSGGVISNTTGSGDYRISFSQGSPFRDTAVKLGNFAITGMYLAIGAGKTSNVTIQGFRAGRMMAQATIFGLSESNVGVTSSSATDLTYNGSDANSGINIQFGTNWAFLDGIRILVNAVNTPLSIDDLNFADPTNFQPGSQPTNITPLNTTGISSTVSWSITGAADYNTVFMKQGANAANDPVDGTDYTANTAFGSGQQIGSTGWHAVYDGQGTTVNVSGLTPGTAYTVKVLAYNGNTGWKDYLTTTSVANLTSFTTIAIPTTQATDITAMSITGSTATLNWTIGNGSRRAVFVSLTNTGTAAPAHSTNYTANVNVNAGTLISGTTWRCVFNGTGSSVNITNLTVGQTYRAMVTEYNDNGLGSVYSTYNTSAATNNPVNFTMDAAPVVTTAVATAVSSSGATLNGSINDMGATTTNSFQYATNPSLTSPSTSAASPVSITEGGGLTIISGILSGLIPSTTYYFRGRGVNAVGATNGSTLSFTTAPATQFVSASNANGRYKAGDVIAVQVVFTGAVTVTGTPTLALSTGGTASYASGSGSNTITLNYTILAGHNSTDLNYSSTSALALSGGTIRDANNNDVTISLPPVAAIGSLAGQKDIIVDTDAPLLTTVGIVSSNAITSAAKAGDQVTVSFTANEGIATPTVTIGAGAATVTNTGGNNWEGIYTMTTADVNGTVTFSIAFNDLAGNAGTAVTVTSNSSSVNFDKTVPVLNPVTIASGNANTARAKTGDLLTLSFTASETIAAPSVTIAGGTASVTNTGGNNWAASYTMSGAESNGVVAFNISFSDLTGNAGTVVMATTNSGIVTFDKTVPSLTSVTILSGNANTMLAKVGDLITLSFTADEAVFTPTVTIAGHTAIILNTGGNNWTATYTMTTGDATGVVPFNIIFSDITGNAGTAVSASTNSSSILFDKTAPLLPAVTILSDNANTAAAKPGDKITVGFTANEAVFTPTVTIGGNGAAVTNTGGNSWAGIYTMTNAEATGVIPFSITFTDVAGNAGTVVSATTNSSSILFDKTSPLLSAVTISSDNTNTSVAQPGNKITVSFTANEAVFTPTVTIGGNTATVTNTGANGWSAVYTMTNADATGTIPFSIAFTDIAGNTGTAVSATSNSSTVVFDKIVPSLVTVAIISDNANTSLARVGNKITVSFTASEAVFTPSVTIAGNAATVVNPGGNNWVATYSMTNTDATGTVSFSISFRDLQNNPGTTVAATTNSSNVVFDKTVPVLTAVVILSDNANTSLAKPGNKITVSFTASESVFTPSVTIAGNAAAIVNTGGNNWAASHTLTGNDAGGNIPFTVAFSDLAGNTGNAVTATTNSSVVVYDKTLPELNAVSILSSNTIPSLAKTGDIITLNFTANESIEAPVVTLAGITVSAVNTTGNTWSATHTISASTADGTLPFSIAFSDLSGNAGVAVTATTNNSSVRFDKTRPVMTVVTASSSNTEPSLAKTGDIATIRFTASETVVIPVVSIAGGNAVVTNTGGNTWAASYTMSMANTAGIVAFSISFTDLAGNQGITVTTTTNNSKIVFDKTAPLLTTVQIGSANAIPAKAKAGDKITLFFTASEAIAAPVITLSGQLATVTNTSVNNWTASYTMTDGDTEGLISFIIPVTDLAGNAGITTTATTDNSQVMFDRTKPFVTAHQRLSVSPTDAVSVQYKVLFSERVIGVDKTDFGLTFSASLAGAVIESVTGSDSVYTVTVNTGAGDGTIRLDLNASATGITDLTGNGAGGFTSGEVYTINKIGPPAITAVPLNSITCAGASTGFSVTATSSVAITYQWQVNAGGGFVNLSNTAPYSNVTTAALSIAGTTTALNNYQYRCVVSNIHGSVNSAAAVLTVNALPVVTPVTGINNVCVNGNTTLGNLTTGGVWTSSNTAAATVNASSGIVTGVAAGGLTITYTVTNAGGCATAVTSAFTVNGLPTVSLQPMGGMVSRGNTILLTATASAGTTINWTPAASLDNPTSFTPLARPLDNTTYTATVTTAAGCIASSSIMILSTLTPDVVDAAEVFSPNGDGINDRFVIKNIDAYPDNNLQVFNKGGKLVYEANFYRNQWDGTYKNVPLPTDTYFYVLRSKGVIIKKGAVNIVQNKR